MVLRRNIDTRIFGTRTWLVALVALQMVFIIPQNAEVAEAALDWDDVYIVASGSITNYQRIAVDGDNVYVVYGGDYRGTPITNFRWYDGNVWSGQMTVGTPMAETRDAAICAVDGVAHIAYVEFSSGDAKIMYTTYDGSSWSTPFRVSSPTPGMNAYKPEIAVEGPDIFIVWEDLSDNDPDIFMRSREAGRWGTSIEISKDSRNEYQTVPQIAVRGGNVHVVWWHSYIDIQDVYYRVRTSQGWQDPVEIGVDIADERQNYPTVAVDHERVYVTYGQNNRGENRIFMRIHESGAWGDPKQVGFATPTSGSQFVSRIEAEDGHVAMVFRHVETDQDIYFRHLNRTRWMPEEAIATGIPTTAPSLPDVALQNGRVHAVWFEEDGGSKTIKYRTAMLDVEDPEGTAAELRPYWMGTRVSVGYSATDDYSLTNVTLRYRYSTNKVDWDRWKRYSSVDGLHGNTSSGTISFDPPDGEGFYEFTITATDRAGNTESPPLLTEAEGALDLTAPTGSLVINGGDEFSNNTTVSLAITYTDKMTDANSTLGKPHYQVRLSNDETTWSDWAFGVATMEWDLPEAEGCATVYCQVMDEAGLVSDTFNDTTVLDLTDPTGTIVIDDDDEWTTSREVTLNVTFSDGLSGVAGIRFGDEAVGGDEPWENPAEERQWTLPEGDGTVRVCYQVLDVAGRTSEVYYDEIGLDTAAPTGSIAFDVEDGTTTDSTVTLLLSYEDATSGVSQVRFSEEMVGGDEPWEDPVDTKEWDLGTESGEKSVYYQVMDVVGLVSAMYKATVILDLDMPTGTIALQNGATTSNTLMVQLVLTYEDETSNVVGIRVTNEAIGGDEPWENPVESMEWTLEGEDGEKTVYYQVIDAPGQVSEVYSLTITVDTTNPSVTLTDPEEGEDEVAVDTTIVVRFSEEMDATSTNDAVGMKWVDKDGASHQVLLTFDWSTDGKTLTLAPSSDLEPGTEYELEIGTSATDLFGNGLDPSKVFSFTTQGDGGDGNGDGNGGDGDGDGGDDDGTGGLWLAAIVAVVAIVVIGVAAMWYMGKRPGASGGGGEELEPFDGPPR